HGAVFFDLTSLNDPNDVAELVLNSFGLKANRKQGIEDLIVDYCREKEMLLIFDNFEHVLPAASLLAKLLESSPTLKIIATSRERLNLRIETAYFLEPVYADGVELFTEVALMMHSNIEILESDEPDIKRIVKIVGGLPLGLVLAATWLDTLSISEIGDEIESSLDFLSTELQDMPDRQRSMHAVIDPTWNRLNQTEQKAFMWASVFRGGFSREHYQQATGASLRAIQSLLRRSLIQHGHGRRYSMHPLIQQFAIEKLTARAMVHDAKAAHLATFTSFAQQQYQNLLGKQFLEGIHQLELEHGNIRAALDWSLGQEKAPDQAVTLTLSMVRFWFDKSLLREAAGYLKQAVQHQPDNAQAHMNLGYCHYRLGDAAATEASLNTAIELAKASGDMRTLANSYRILVPVYFSYRKSSEEILGLLESALEIAQSLNDLPFIATCHDSLGMSLLAFGRPPAEVLVHYEKALKIYEEHGNPRQISAILFNMAIEYYRMRDVERARDLCGQSLDFVRQLNDKIAMARRMARLASWDIVEEEFERANTLLTEAQSLSREVGERGHLMYATYIQGILLTITGEYKKASVAFCEVLRLADALTDLATHSKANSNLGLLFILQGEVVKARPYVTKSLQSIEETAFSPWAAMIAYANYLWCTNQTEACARITATMSKELKTVERGEAINNQYFLRPLIYRVKESLGEQAWEAILTEANDVNLKQHYQKALQSL
ncbi:MAG: tetratricopeptide repeat protein, partial [Chloroflexota bacterium]